MTDKRLVDVFDLRQQKNVFALVGRGGDPGSESALFSGGADEAGTVDGRCAFLHDGG